MAINTYVTSVDPERISSIKTEDKEILMTLGHEEENIAIQLNELFNSVREKLSTCINIESQLTIEVSGSISLKAEAGVKYLFFNVGGKAESSDKMKVILNTTLSPKA